MASSTARPQPSLTDGKASASALRYRSVQLVLAHRAEQDHVTAELESERRAASPRACVAVGAVVLERVAHR